VLKLFIKQSLTSVHDYQEYPTGLESPVQHEAANPPPHMPLAYTPPDNLGLSLFGALSGICNQALPTAQNHPSLEELDLDWETESFLIQTYFEMAHSQYPFLLKHQFLEWAESWRSQRDTIPASMRWKGFFVYMVSFTQHAESHSE
jgi:hypothetical protein